MFFMESGSPCGHYWDSFQNAPGMKDLFSLAMEMGGLTHIYVSFRKTSLVCSPAMQGPSGTKGIRIREEIFTRYHPMEHHPRLRGLITDIDGTLTDPGRRIHTGAMTLIRDLVDRGIPVVLASGNTSCFMDAVSRMIGTGGTYIGENGGIIRTGYDQDLTLLGDGGPPRRALDDLMHAYRERGITLDLYSLPYRFVDVAFAKTVPVDEVRGMIRHHPVEVLDTGFAIHLHPPGVSKGEAFSVLAGMLGLAAKDFLAVGDAENDIDLIKRAGVGVAVANSHPDLARSADWVTKKRYGDGFVEAIKEYSSYFLER